MKAVKRHPMSDAAWDKFLDYLNRHEHDIACGINDFDGLSDVFKSIFGRDPLRD